MPDKTLQELLLEIAEQIDWDAQDMRGNYKTTGAIVVNTEEYTIAFSCLKRIR